MKIYCNSKNKKGCRAAPKEKVLGSYKKISFYAPRRSERLRVTAPQGREASYTVSDTEAVAAGDIFDAAGMLSHLKILRPSRAVTGVKTRAEQLEPFGDIAEKLAVLKL